MDVQLDEKGGQRLVPPDWMPRSGYGPASAIPERIDGSHGSILESAHAIWLDIERLKQKYTERAEELAARANQSIAEAICACLDSSGEELCHDCQIQLVLQTRENFLFMTWVCESRTDKGTSRGEAPIESCMAHIGWITKRCDPQVFASVLAFEAEAAAIRLRWFGLVRLAHYLNVVGGYCYLDREPSGEQQVERTAQRGWLRGLLDWIVSNRRARQGMERR